MGSWAKGSYVLWILFVLSTAALGYTSKCLFIYSSIGIIFAIFCIGLFYHQEKIKLIMPYACASLIILLLIGLYNIQLIQDFRHYYETMYRLIVLIAIVFFGYNFIRHFDRRHPMKLWNASLKAYVTVMILQAAYAYFQEFTIGDGERVTGFFENPNHFGITLAIGVLFLVSNFLNKNVNKLFLIIVIGWLLGAIILSGSRQALIGVAIGIIVQFFIQFIFSRTHHRKTIFLTIVGSLIPIITVFWIMSANGLISDRLVNLSLNSNAAEGHDNGTYSLDHRSEFYAKGLKMWKDYPLTGIGVDQFRVYSTDYGVGQTGVYAHSNYIELLTTFGAIGLLIYLINYLVFFIKLMLSKDIFIRKDRLGIYSFAVAFLLFLVFADTARITYYGPVEWLVFLLIQGEVAAVLKAEESDLNETQVSIQQMGIQKA